MSLFDFLHGFLRSCRIAAVVAAVCLSAAAAESDAYPPLDARQSEILKELTAAAPPAGLGANATTGDAAPWLLDSWDVAAGMEKLVAFPVAPGNAAAHFKKLEELYESEKGELERDGWRTLGVDELLKAAEKADCRLIPDYYPEFDRITSKQPDFLVVRSYFRALAQRAERAERAGGGGGEAERCYQAALLCGRHLANDRPSALVYMTGLIVTFRAAKDYEGFLRRAGRSEQADLAAGYAASVAEMLRIFYWKANVALGETRNFACLPATIRIALDDREVCWRKEAVVRLAILRHGVPDPQTKRLHREPAWEKIAEDVLAAVAERDPDAATRHLAAWSAVHVKPEMYDDLEHSFGE